MGRRKGRPKIFLFWVSLFRFIEPNSTMKINFCSLGEMSLNASKLYKSIKPRYVSMFIDLMGNVSLMLNETMAPYIHIYIR
jgi:hypothetical protein